MWSIDPVFAICLCLWCALASPLAFLLGSRMTKKPPA